VKEADERVRENSDRQVETGEEVVLKIVKNPFHMNEARLQNI
jgi:hypothetical protein